jgi:hypothetical protein
MASLMDLIHKAGFQGNAANIMYAIVMAESGGDAHAHNGNTGTGDNSYGLAQINMLGAMGPERLKEYGLHSYNDLFDPLTNLKVAYKMSGGGTHFGDWSTYNRGEYKQYLGQSGATVSASTLHGSQYDTLNGPSSSSTSADYKQALGPLAGLLTGIPELKSLLDKAIASDQPVNDFINSVENSPWYRSHSETVRENIALQFSDPATYQAHRKTANGHIQQLADQLGVRLSHDQLVSLTTQYTLGAWDDQTLQHALGSYYKRNEAPTGQAAQFYQTLAQTYADYGVPYSNATLQYRVQQLVAGNTTADTYKQAAINAAKGLYPGLSQQLDQGLTVKDIADPYMQTMANMLEINPNTVKLTDPLVQKALQGQVVAEGGKATPTVTTLSQFQQQLRADPRWQYTQNSKDEMSTALMHVGGDFGFTEI